MSPAGYLRVWKLHMRSWKIRECVFSPFILAAVKGDKLHSGRSPFIELREMYGMWRVTENT